MQIKVKDTRMHKVNTRYLDLNILGEDVGQVKDRIKEVPVAEAKLVLVEYYAESNNEIREYWKDVTPKTGSLPTWRPILISETEKIEAGDKYYEPTDANMICTAFKHTKQTYYRKKILALPEHFSPKHLQAIVDGKLKEGKVLVECEMMCPNKDGGCEEFNKTGKECTHLVPWIKLNSSNHITLHKIEEKMYTRKEMINHAYKLAEYIRNEDVGFDHFIVKEWFDKNVK